MISLAAAQRHGVSVITVAPLRRRERIFLNLYRRRRIPL
jgi:predicted HAD superfamily phosphohydrolase YqeG